MGNYQDTMMEQLADKGNGNYYYIDSLGEAKRLFGDRLLSTLQVLARDVKIQVVFDPTAVRRYRLIGYENRAIADDDFRNDKVDAGEVGPGHSVTALYEIELADQSTATDIATVTLRYKDAEDLEDVTEDTSVLTRENLLASIDTATKKFRFTAAVAELAEILKDHIYSDNTLAEVLAMARNNADKSDERETEFISLVEKAIELSNGQ